MRIFLAILVPKFGSQKHRRNGAMPGTASARVQVYTTSTFVSGGTEGETLTPHRRTKNTKAFRAVTKLATRASGHLLSAPQGSNHFLSAAHAAADIILFDPALFHP